MGLSCARALLLSLFLTSLTFSCSRAKPEKPSSSPPASSQADKEPQTPNRFDSLAWPEVTTDDKFLYAERLAPAILAIIEERKIPFSVIPEEAFSETIEDFLREGLPTPTGEPSPPPEKADSLEALAISALEAGLDTPAWEALQTAVLATGNQVELSPFRPPGAVRASETGIQIAFEMSMGFEWFSYLSCKALLRGDKIVRAELLGGPPGAYRWTPGEEELCLWALVGTREYLRGEVGLGRAPRQDASLERLDKAARAGRVRGFALVEFLLPRLGKLAGLERAELQAAAAYLLHHALQSTKVAGWKERQD